MLNPPIGKSNHPNTVLIKPLGSGLVVALLGRFSVVVAIEFHDELMFATVKIEDKVVKRVLPPELETKKLAIA